MKGEGIIESVERTSNARRCWRGRWRQPLARPSFFPCLNMNNVNAELWRAQSLLALWDFLEYKGRIGRTHVILHKVNEPSLLKIMPTKCRSRYFDDGRLYMSGRIRIRLGRYHKVPGLMETLTYDTKRIGKREAWASFGQDTRRFLNGVNQYRKRRGWRRLHYLWVVEVQRGTGYPHVHIFFPNLRWLAPLKVINGNWGEGRANVESPKKIKVSCAAYVSKYLRKMEGWLDLHLAMLWCGKCRMYGFSRGFSCKIGKRESEWRRWQIVETGDRERLEKVLEEGAYAIEQGC
ncbi:MAG: hypothetical protein A2Z77_02110 [Chloroflexi bacterium RBG_13_51_36]|nr:MAG: hypothetical protein A2Z77_02110 [Chloroflexi bacterium RBG_13_51_36]